MPSLLIILTVFFTTSVFCQGWQSMGPDSVNWQNVRRVSGKWSNPTTYRLAAATSGSIAVLQNGSQWNYSLRGYEGSEWFPGYGFFSLEFSPWDDSVYIGYADYYTEPSFIMFKSIFPMSGRSNRLPGGCWITPLSVIFSPNDSVVFATECGIHRSTNRGSSWTLL